MQSGLSGYLPSNIQYTSFMPLILGIILVIIVFVAIHIASGSNTVTLARAKSEESTPSRRVQTRKARTTKKPIRGRADESIQELHSRRVDQDQHGRI